MKTLFTYYSILFPRIYCIWFFSLCLLCFSIGTEVPKVPILQMNSESLTTVQLVELSYQPLLVSEALTEATATTLTPWLWPLLPRWVDAAITFTTAFPARSHCQANGRSSCEGKVMSLRKFYKSPAKKSAHAITNITTHMGSSIDLPIFLSDADFSFLDFTKTTLHHARQGWSDHEDEVPSTSVMCSVEGKLKTMFKPFQTSWDKLKCEDTCNLEEDAVSPEEKNLLVTITGDLNPRECIYIPQGWSWKLSAPEDTTFLWLVWEEDLIILEDALDALIVEVEEDIEGSGVQDPIHQPSDEQKSSDMNQPQRISGKLAEYLPTNLKKMPTLWSSATHIRHVINRYLLTEQNLNKDDFVGKFKNDRILFPHLVDCLSECEFVVKSIFHQLDADDNGILTSDDANNLQPKSFRSLMHELDDLVEELSELAMDQWKGVVKDEGATRHEFMERARNRMEESGKSYLERWKRGDMDPEEEAALKEHMPELYEEIMASRKLESPKDEL